MTAGVAVGVHAAGVPVPGGVRRHPPADCALQEVGGGGGVQVVGDPVVLQEEGQADDCGAAQPGPLQGQHQERQHQDHQLYCTQPV